LSPRIRIDLLMRLAVTLGRRGSPERALDLLERLHDEARTSFGPHDPLTLAVLERASKYDIERGAFDAARAKIDALLADPAVPGSGELQANVLLRAASLAWKTGNFADSLRGSAHALELANSLDAKAIASEALTMRAGALLASGDAANALDAYEDLVQGFKERYGPVHGQVSLAYSGLARAYRRLGRLAESEDAARAAIAIDRQVYAANHWILANHLNALVMTLLERRKFDEALQAAEESLEICRLTLADGHINLTTAKYTTGNVLLQMGRYRDALGYLREALAEHAAALGDDSSDTLVTRAAYGYALAMAGEEEAGVRELEAAIDVNRRRDSPDYTLLAKAMEKRIRLAIADSDLQAVKARLPALEEVVRSIPAYDRRIWCARDSTLRARMAYSEGQWTAVEQALQAAASTIEEHGCGNAAIAVENALLSALGRSRQGFASDASDARETYARALSLKFPPPEVTELTRQIRVIAR
jgi:tetratricopeptide (TPR) repeat protein